MNQPVTISQQAERLYQGVSNLQRRLDMAATIPEALLLVENVPLWPGEQPELRGMNGAYAEYSDCRGRLDLRRAICRREEEVYGVCLSPDQIVITNGASHAFSLLARSIFQPGARAVCQAPLLIQMDHVLRSIGYDVSYVDMSRPDCERFVRDALRQDVPTLLLLNSPHNPTGQVLDADTIQNFVELTRMPRVHLVVDAVYDLLTEPGVNTVLPLTETATGRVHVLNSMSKNYGAPGLRIGWIATSSQLALRLTAALESECISVCTNSQVHACELLTAGNDEIVAAVDRDRAFIRQDVGKLLSVDPIFNPLSGGTVALLKLPVEDVETFTDYFLQEHSVALVTSSNYAAAKFPFIRLPLGRSRALLIETILRLQAALAQWNEHPRPYPSCRGTSESCLTPTNSTTH